MKALYLLPSSILLHSQRTTLSGRHEADGGAESSQSPALQETERDGAQSERPLRASAERTCGRGS